MTKYVCQSGTQWFQICRNGSCLLCGGPLLKSLWVGLLALLRATNRTQANGWEIGVFIILCELAHSTFGSDWLYFCWMWNVLDRHLWAWWMRWTLFTGTPVSEDIHWKTRVGTSFKMTTYARMSIAWATMGDLLYHCVTLHSVVKLVKGNSKLIN